MTRFRVHTTLGSLAVTLLLLLAAPAQAQPEAVPGELLVRYVPGTSSGERTALRSDFDLERPRPLSWLRRAERVGVDATEIAGLERLATRLERRPDVAWAEPNYIVHGDAAPPDELYSNPSPWLWGLRNPGSFVFNPSAPGPLKASLAGADIDAAAAWDITTGSSQVTVAVVDTGYYADHNDLDERDVNGFDFVVNAAPTPQNPDGIVEDDPDPGTDSDPDDRNGHGTHVAGTIAAEAGNVGEIDLDDAVAAGSGGSVGVAWDVRVMSLRALDANSRGTAATTGAAFDYAGDNGARVVNASLSGPGISQAHVDAIAQHPDVLYVVAAGNDGTNNDDAPRSPCNVPLDNVVCVGATDSNDARATFTTGASNFGATSVDLFAPGKDVWSADGDPAPPVPRTPTSMRRASGTSMATPHVAGIAALILSAEPQTPPLQLKNCLMRGTEPLAALAGLSVTGGRANARLALDICTDHTPPSAPGIAGNLNGRLIRQRTPTIAWTASTDDRSGLGQYRLVVDGADVQGFAPGVLSGQPPAPLADGSHVVRTDAVDVVGNRAIGAEQRFTVDGTKPRLKLRALRGPGVRLRVRASERVSLTAKVKAKGRNAKAKLRGKLKGGKRGKVRVRIPRRLLRRLSPGNRVTVIVTGRDLAGNSTTKRVRTRL